MSSKYPEWAACTAKAKRTVCDYCGKRRMTKPAGGERFCREHFALSTRQGNLLEQGVLGAKSEKGELTLAVTPEAACGILDAAHQEQTVEVGKEYLMVGTGTNAAQALKDYAAKLDKEDAAKLKELTQAWKGFAEEQNDRLQAAKAEADAKATVGAEEVTKAALKVTATGREVTHTRWLLILVVGLTTWAGMNAGYDSGLFAVTLFATGALGYLHRKARSDNNKAKSELQKAAYRERPSPEA